MPDNSSGYGSVSPALSMDPYGAGSGYGSDTLSAMGESNDTNTPPAGATGQDANGNWFDSFGNLIKQVSPIIGPIIKAVATPYINNIESGGLLKQSQQMIADAPAQLKAVNAPNLLALIPQLQKQVQQGTMTAAQAQAALQEASNMQGVQTDAQSLEGQRQGLNQLSEIAANKGVTEADRAQMNALMAQANANAAQQRQAQIQQLQMQGNAGTGAELAARLAGGQQAANSNAAAGATLAQNAQQRALQAIQEGITGNQALNAQQFQQQASKAQAQDAVNQFNAAAKNAIAQSNAQLGQQSNLANFNMANTIAGKNTDITNQNLLMPYQATQANFTNQLDKAKNVASADVLGGGALAKAASDQITRSSTAGGTPAQQTSSSGSSGGGTDWGKVIGGVGSIIGSIFSDEDLKKDKHALSDDDVDQMMAKMTGYKYRYKGPKSNPQQTGVMAQDVEKGMPDSVVDTPAGKMVQKPEMMSHALAILANQHERIKKLEGR